MHLQSLRLFNFRCYDTLELEADPRINIIHGLNGQGKTSILEAIGVLVFLKSFRNAKNSEMLRYNQTVGAVSGQIIGKQELSIQLNVKLLPKRKLATLNGKFCKYISEYVGKTSAVSFSPNDLEIIRGSPENRRNWIDRVSYQYFPEHLDLLQNFQKVLEQRNRYLKNMAEGRVSFLSADFEIWTEQLIQFGSQVIHNRIHSVDNSVKKIEAFYEEISHQKVDLKINYLSDLFEDKDYRQAGDSLLELISQTLKEKLQLSLKKELILGTTLMGPHRDDLDFKLSDHSAKAFGSQGEIRSLVLAMRLLEVEIATMNQKTKSILLIDDFSSELDEKRRNFLLDYLLKSDNQVFLSTTEKIKFGKLFNVSQAKVTSA